MLYEPFYIDEPNPGYPGFDVEIAQEFANFWGVELKVIPLKDFSEHVSLLKKGNTQMAIAAISIDLERMKDVYFTSPYLISSSSGLVRRGVLPPEPEGQIITQRPFKSLLDLKILSQVSFAARAGGKNNEFLKQNFAKNPIYTYLNNYAALGALKKNSVDCFVADSYFIRALLIKEPELRTNFLPLLDPISEEHTAIAVSKDDLEFREITDMILQELKRSGRISEIAGRYFSSDQWVKK